MILKKKKEKEIKGFYFGYTFKDGKKVTRAYNNKMYEIIMKDKNVVFVSKYFKAKTIEIANAFFINNFGLLINQKQKEKPDYT